MQKHPWIDSHPPGTDWHASLRSIPLVEWLREAVSRWPGRVALSFEGQRFTYAQLDAMSDRLAEGLCRSGVVRGMHVGLYLPNTPHYYLGFLAILKAGAVIVNYSPLDAGAVLEHKIGDSHTDLILTLDTPELFGKMNAFLDSTRLKALVVGSSGDFGLGAAAQAGSVDLVAWDERRISFAALLEPRSSNGAAPAPAARPATDASELAVLQYTGGTTGQPKGAMLTHANLSSAVSQLRRMWLDGGTLREGEERFLVVLPLFHVYSMVANLLFGLSIGAEMILHRRFEVQAVVDDMAAHGVSVFFGVPTMYVALAASPALQPGSLSTLRLCNSGGAPISAETHRAFVHKAGCRLHEGWGMTETCGVGTLSTGVGEHPVGSCGVPVAGAEIRFVDVHSLQPVPLGERGELWVRGPHVMKGYWNQARATAETIVEGGFLRTGDVGYMSGKGIVYLVDRTKDMMICGGFNVYPRHIEEAIYRHPAVEEVIVIGIADPYRGQSPKAFVKLRDGAAPFGLEEMRAFLVPFLGKHEMPGALEFRGQLPKTPVGKLSKKELYAEAAAGGAVAGAAPPVA